MLFSRLPSSQGVSISSLALLSLLASGCAAPTQFRPARTLPKGDIEPSVILEGFAYQFTYREPRQPCFDCDPFFDERKDPWVPGPAAALRYGLTDHLELGLAAGLLSLRGDLTTELLRSRWIDLAVGVGLGIDHYLLSPVAGSLSTPLIAGFNLHPMLSITPHLGFTWWVPFDAGPHGFLDIGLGLDLRIARRLSLRPHVSRLWLVTPRNAHLWEPSYGRAQHPRLDALYMGLAIAAAAERY